MYTDAAMSAFRSTTLSDGQHSQHPRVTGFNDHSQDDPFLPSSEDDEQLAHFAATELSPNPPGYRASVSPALSRASIVPPASPLDTHLESLGPPPSTPAANGFQNAADPPQTLHNPFNPNVTYDLLSPNNQCSDNGYFGSSEHTGSPDYGDDFYHSLENDLGLGLVPGFPVPPKEEAELHDGEMSDPVSSGTRKSQDTKKRKTSSGTATLSSHLMSPVLTDAASPGSADGFGTPTAEERNRHLEAETNTRLNSGESTGLEAHVDWVQRTTPALTSSSKGNGSSRGTSPNGFPHPAIARAVSPNIRVETYSRGDSPARGASLVRAGSKRSHGSSHLTVEEDVDDLDYGGAETVLEDHISPVGSEARGRPFDVPNRDGLDPLQRLQINTEDVPNFKDLEDGAQSALKKADVEEWLSRSEAGSEVGSEAALPPNRPKLPQSAKWQRTESAGDSLSHANLESLRTARAPPPDLHIPGPGVLINEDSGEEDEELSGSDASGEDIDRPESPPTTTEAITNGTQTGPGHSLHHQGNSEVPLLYRAKLWQDPVYDSSDPGVKVQPTTSNEAMYKYEQCSREFDNLSRAATWGTRRVSDSDLAGLFHRMSISSRVDAGEKDKATRRGSFFEQAAAKIRSRRRASILKHKESDLPPPVSRPKTLEHSKKDSSGSLSLPAPIRRMSSLGKRPKSPRINTGSAVAALTSSVAFMGAGGSRPVSATATSTPCSPWASAKNVVRRSRSRSDMHGPASPSTNLTELWTKHGGPPMPGLAAPQREETKSTQAEHSEDAEEDDEEGADDKGVTIDLSIRADPIIPTLDGFRSNVRQLNPRLPAFMIERISQEQLRRYKKLVEFKVKHAQAINIGKCGSGKHCPVLGGEPTYLPSKSITKEPELSHTGFSIAGLGQSDDDANALAEGIVTPAQFPDGVPMPPVKRLPAEFECSLCFKVKKFHKPSDWSKHVHEDVQPFTCTFVNCAEPKSFKRKADWVRHENERHRQLEWWLCNYNDCNHKCYRKDNFVQHLVREHKLPEPKIKSAKTSKPAVRGPSAQKARKQLEEQNEELPEEIDQVWKLVEMCKHETQKNAKDEACKFCGNICNSFKKLTVHLAKHMEQISMPVLGIVEKKDVTPETIISPIEQRNSHQPAQSPSTYSTVSQIAPSSVSYYGVPPTAVTTGYTPMQSPAAYYIPGTAQTTNMAAYHRGGASYPPQMPSSQPSPGFPTHQANANPYNLSSYPSYGTPPTPTFIPANDPRAISQSESPEQFYHSMRNASVTNPQSAPYSQAGPFQPPNAYQQHAGYQQQQQTPFTNSLQTPTYAYAGSPRVPSAPHGAPTSAPMPYNLAGDLGFSQASGMGGRMYPGQQGPGYGY